jgi:hypothetical protein
MDRRVRKYAQSALRPACERLEVRELLSGAGAAVTAPGEVGMSTSAGFTEFRDPDPAPGDRFGATVLPLSTGNVVITSPFDNAGGGGAGAVYLFNGATGALISTLIGSHPGDNVGNGGVTDLGNGNYVVSSPNWSNGAATSAGAVTWGSGTTGVSGPVTAANSLVGSTTNDSVGSGADVGVTALRNGNYVVTSPNWTNGTAAAAGAVTWGSGTTGVSGPVSAANSLVGSTADDSVGNYSVTVLSDGNYVVASPNWTNGAANGAGAVTWGSGTAGVSGPVSAANSLVGSTAGDQVGIGVIDLGNGNYVVASPNWTNTNGAAAAAGAVTWVNGAAGVTGPVSAANSLVGSTANDSVGGGNNGGNVMPLSNGNYVVDSPNWTDGATGAASVGAVTWGSGTAGISGPVSDANSLVGSTANDSVGGFGVTALSNGNYVVDTAYWNNGDAAGAGAVTWGSGTAGISGPVSAANSLVGSTANDGVGAGRVTALSNGSYVVTSPYWNNGDASTAGAVTWGSGTAGVSGPVSAANSLVGSTAGDMVGGIVTDLGNGNYVVSSPSWNNGAATYAGAVTWGSGTTGVSGPVSAANSLVGSTANDSVGDSDVLVLSNGNYVVNSSQWTNGAAANAGAVTWGSGTAGVSGPVSATNSLVGSTANDSVGDRSVAALSNGNYVVSSPQWNNGEGAVTWGSGTAGISGPISDANSLVGSRAGDSVGGGGVTPLSNGNYVVSSPNWANGAATGAGAVTWGSGTAGVSGPIRATNSLVGTPGYFGLSGFNNVTPLSDGNYVVSMNHDYGAVTPVGTYTWGSGTAGVSGVISTTNSVTGSAAIGGMGSVVQDNVNGTFIGPFVTDGGSGLRVGSQATGFPAAQTITFGPLPARTYGDAPFTLSAGASSLLPVNYSIVAGAAYASINGNTVTILGATPAGTVVTVEATQAGDGSDLAAPPVDQSFTISKATPTATLAVTNSPLTYNASGQAATVSISTSSVPGTLANIQTGGAATQTNAATYPVTADFVPNDSANYTTLTGVAAGNLMINKATPTATLAVATSPLTYNASGQAATVKIATSSVPGTVANVHTGGAATQTNAATYPVTADFVPNDTTNYTTLTGLAAGNVVINKASSATALASSVSTSVPGQAVTFTATVTSPAGTPSGTVSLMNGATTFGTGTLGSNGQATITATLPQGAYSLTAVYAGNNSFQGSSSQAKAFTVNTPTSSPTPTPTTSTTTTRTTTPTPTPTTTTTPTPTTTLPQVLAISGVSSRKGLTSFTVRYNEPLSSSSAGSSGLYQAFAAVRKTVKKYKGAHFTKALVETDFTKALAIRSVSPDSTSSTVTVNLARPVKGQVQVMVQGNITAGNGASNSVRFTQDL